MQTNSPKIIGYIRVSTKQQGESGLGLEAQLSSISKHTSYISGELLQTYREVETGTNSKRPELQKAIQHAKRSKATLVIAKLDRLARNAHFVTGLMESKVDFVCCDMPAANKLTITIMAAIAEHEAEAISQRTKAALQAAKQRGTLLGSARPGHWAGRENIRLNACKLARIAARAKHKAITGPIYSPVQPIIETMRAAGATLQAIADRLNQQQYQTATGAAWNKMQVSRLLKLPQ